MNSTCRRGFSLLEVLLATSILLGCLVVLSELAAVGRIHASVAQDGGTALRICQSKVNEILAGLAPVTPVREEPLDDPPGWWYSVDVEQVRHPGVLALRVTVGQDDDSEERPIEYSLVRWIRDPKFSPRGQSSAGDELRLPPGFRGRRVR
jgi:prepilin-type N-terminal cleavage/methylation domain-containing protein